MPGPVFLFGAGSMLGWSLWCARGDAPVTGFGNRDPRRWPEGIGRGLHLNDEAAVAGLFAREQPRLIVRCAGVCDVLVLARANTLVVRSGLWIGPSATGRIGHLDWLRHRHRRGLPMTMVLDEVRSAVWAEDAARRVWALARSAITGIRHVTATRAVARPELARFVDRHFAIGATFGVQLRGERRAPHIGNVELATRHRDHLAAPLPAVVPL